MKVHHDHQVRNKTSEHEGTSFWVQVLTCLCSAWTVSQDFLTRENSLKYVWYKYRKELARDLKEIYNAGTLEGAEAALLRLEEKWNEKSQAIYALWERNCEK